MRRLRTISLLAGLLAGLLATVGLMAPAAGAAPAQTVPSLPAAGLGFGHFTFKRVCAAPAPGHAACESILATPTTTTPGAAPASSAAPLATGGPAYGPADLRSAYNLPGPTAPGSPGSGQTVAIVDAYNDPNAAADLAVYRSNYSLPACTTASGCFRQVSQTGSATSLPANNASWSQEISLDLDMVSAICPNCHIVLVEASSSGFADLAAAVSEAARLGATQISNSYGGSEYSGETSAQASYDQPGIDVTVSSGDSGYGVEFPAASQYVTAVGGTRLTRTANARGWTESVWSTSASEGAGSGCSAYIAKPSWQPSLGGCAKRTVADVSADADPATGVAVYDSYAYQGASGWLQFGGTSVASPIIASVDALAGGRAKGGYSFGQYPYLNTSQFYDVTSGSTASCGTYLWTAEVGYDGPTGIGTPDGAAPVTPPAPPVDQVAPTISGTPAVGQPLSANPGTWTGSPSFTYQWQSCTTTCTTVATASGPTSTYTPVAGDVGHTIKVIVTAANSAGSAAATSAPTAPVVAPPPSFSLTASPASQSVVRGKSATYTITVAPTGGFAGSVALSASGLPTGVTAKFSPAATTTTSALTLTSTTSSPSGAYAIPITGTSGSLHASTTLTLTLTGTCFFGFCF
jgi:hypothetical protein